MYSVKIDSKGSLVVILPQNDMGTIILGEKFLEYEASLPSQERLLEPDHALMSTLLLEAKTAAGMVTSNETVRAVSSADYAAAVSEMKVLMDDALAELKHRNRKTPARVREWGVNTTIGLSGKILYTAVKTDRQWIDLNHSYVIKEQSLPENERISDPPLERLAALDQIIQSNLSLRTASLNERGIGVRTRTAAASRLLDMLQVAGALLCLKHFDGCVEENLTRWGYKVIAKKATATVRAAETPMIEEAAEQSLPPNVVAPIAGLLD